MSPELEARLIELSSQRETRHDAIYFGLSTLQEKSEAVVDALVDALSDPDSNNSGRALWGLGHGVSAAGRPKAADAFLALFESRGSARTRNECLRSLRTYGSEKHAAALERFAREPGVDEDLKRQITAAVRRIRSRRAR